MGLSKRKVLLIGADEAQFGVSALAGKTTSELALLAMPVIDPQPTIDVALLDRKIAGGTKGKRPTAVGRATAGVEFRMELVGAEDPTNTEPAWMRNAKAAGCRVVAGLKITCTHDGASSTSAAAAKFGPAEQITGKASIVNDSWYDAEQGGSVVGVPPISGAVTLYPDGGSTSDPEAISGYCVLSSKPIIRINDGADRRPTTGWRIKFDGQAVYAQLSADLPMAIVGFADNDANGLGQDILYCIVTQGTFSTTPGSDWYVCGQKSQCVALCNTIAAHGKAAVPDSQQEVEFVVDLWDNDDPVAGDEIIRHDGLGNVSAGGRVISYNAGTNTVVLQDYWGAWEAGGTVEIVGSSPLSSAVIASDATQTRTPSRSNWTIIDGRKVEVIGARNQMSVSCKNGEAAEIVFEALGSFGSDPEMIVPPNAAPPVTLPPRWQNGYAHANGHRIPFESFDFALNNELYEIPDANSPDGIKGVELTDRDPSLSCTVQTAGTIPGAGDWEKRLADGDWNYFAFALVKGNNRIALVFPRTQLESAPMGGDQLLTHDLSMRCREIAGDDDFFILSF